MVTAKLESRALLAIDPRALAVVYTIPASRANLRIGATEIVDIQGPLTSKDEGLFDSYQLIRDRVQQACLGDASSIVLSINSPGGEVHDCFQTSRDIRAMCAAAGKPLVSYIDGQGCSAAYALATAASTIVAAETSTVGSIGVITERQDVSEMLAREGIKVSYVTSGAKKAYGAPEIPESDAERMDTQRCINNLADLFFSLVEQQRGIPASQVAMLEAGTFVGQEAVKVRLVDQVGTFEALLISSTNASPSVSGGPQPNEARVTFAEICAALTDIAGADGEHAKLAAEMLALTEAQPPQQDMPCQDGPAPTEEPPPEEDQPAPEASVQTAAALAQQLETMAAENRELKARLDGEAKQKFFASHQISDQLKAVLESKPLTEIEAIVAAMQIKPEAKKGLATVKTLQGPKGVSKSPEDLALDRAFGLNKDEGPSVSVRGQVQTFRLAGR